MFNRNARVPLELKENIIEYGQLLVESNEIDQDVLTILESFKNSYLNCSKREFEEGKYLASLLWTEEDVRRCTELAREGNSNITRDDFLICFDTSELKKVSYNKVQSSQIFELNRIFGKDKNYLCLDKFSEEDFKLLFCLEMAANSDQNIEIEFKKLADFYRINLKSEELEAGLIRIISSLNLSYFLDIEKIEELIFGLIIEFDCNLALKFFEVRKEAEEILAIKEVESEEANEDE